MTLHQEILEAIEAKIKKLDYRTASNEAIERNLAFAECMGVITEVMRSRRMKNKPQRRKEES